jgi:hypothetical protein
LCLSSCAEYPRRLRQLFLVAGRALGGRVNRRARRYPDRRGLSG